VTAGGRFLWNGSGSARGRAAATPSAEEDPPCHNARPPHLFAGEEMARSDVQAALDGSFANLGNDLVRGLKGPEFVTPLV